MAPRWLSSGQTAWGLSSERAASTGVLIGIAVTILVVGSVLGYLVRGLADRGPTGTVPNEAVASSAVIDPTFAAMAAADRSPEGAVKAATSLVTALPDLSIRTNNEQVEILSSIIDPNADPQLLASLRGVLATGREQLLPGSTAQLTAKLITTPVTYRVIMQSEDRATVEIWSSRVFLDARGAQLESLWSTTEVGLTWQDRWVLTRFNPRTGPNPPLSAGATTASYGDVAAVLRDSFAYRYALAR